MSASLEERILAEVSRPAYQPIKPKALARRLRLSEAHYAHFRRLLDELVRTGKLELGKAKSVQLATTRDRVVGVFRSVRHGGGFVRPKPGQGKEVGEVRISPRAAGDAATGDVVLVRLRKLPLVPGRPAVGEILEVIERSADKFVGTYRVADGEGFVRVDGRTFHEDIYVGDAAAKGAREGDKVVIQMLRFPSPEMLGEAVIVEILGACGEPGIDLVSVIRQFHLPDEFPSEALAEAEDVARGFADQTSFSDRHDLTKETVVTIDPADAHDFDDAISVTRDRRGFWTLGVHIADVAHFVPAGSELDKEARRRGTSVYLPGRVLPMLPELISNGLASLQQGRPRLAKTVWMEFDPEGNLTDVSFANSIIKVSRRWTYEEAMEYFRRPSEFAGKASAKVLGMMDRMRELAALLRSRRRARGFLELSMPEAELEYDRLGRVTGAHYRVDDESHRLIEEFMLTANEAVARTLKEAGAAFLRRVHEIPDERKLYGFGQFARSLGLAIEDFRSRYELQRILGEVRGATLQHAVHYALLRSLKVAGYGPQDEGHWAVASDCYCHFTSPIRRYPDLTIHRQLDKLLRAGKAGSDYSELVVLGEHCSFTERRSEMAERELIKIKVLEYLSDRVGTEMDMVITGVEDFGFFAQGTEFPAEGLVHVRTLVDDYYGYDQATHSLVGKRTGKRFRLGDRVRCVLWKVDREQRELDLRLAAKQPTAPPGGAAAPRPKPPKRRSKRRR